MEKPISVGDLVWVARPSLCSGDAGKVGVVFQVANVAVYPKGRCASCGKSNCYSDRNHASPDAFNWFPFARLKRIPPLSELEGIKSQEELVA